jgi:hypothetical protein
MMNHGAIVFRPEGSRPRARARAWGRGKRSRLGHRTLPPVRLTAVGVKTVAFWTLRGGQAAGGAISSGANRPEAAGGRGGLGQGVDGGAGRPLFSACDSRFAGFDDVNNSVIAAFGTRNAILTGEREDAHGNAHVCAFSSFEATPAIVISRQSVRFRACATLRGSAFLRYATDSSSRKHDRTASNRYAVEFLTLEVLNLEETD